MKITLHRRRVSSGFTLIELMVVIAIVAVLAGVAYPAYMSYINKADRTACMGNLRDLYNYGIQYANDHRGILPCSGMYDDPATRNLDESKGWWVALVPYVLPDENQQPASKTDPVQVTRIFHCPKDARGGALKGKIAFDATPETVSYVSWTDNSENKNNPRSCIQITRGQSLGAFPWLSDGIPLEDRSIKNAVDFEQQVLEDAPNRHGDYVVFLYADGAVKEVAEPKFEAVAPGLAQP